METAEFQEFLSYFDKVHQRTMKVVRAIPPDKVDWSFREGKWTLGDLVRHIAAANRHIFVETASGRRSSYAGCGKELASSHTEILEFMERMHRECVEILARFTIEQWNGKCTTPDNARVTVWKWLRLMTEHAIHHRGQIYTYLALIEAASPPIYGLTSEQVLERSVVQIEISTLPGSAAPYTTP